MVNVYNIYEINLWSFKHNSNLTPGNSLFGTVKLVKNTDADKYKHSGCGIGFDIHGSFSLSDGSRFGKTVTIFCAGMTSYGHAY